ncbi:hypothetical protein [Heyndrickxia ginsengihumi]|uniref:hypothetical protein n=1 Tax=Heyndrickxia ginsengihumi TaxID=363870 RepID=UPI0004705AD4|nr:hypothetical protein [Heyndrickxia ginsengihumi]
MVYIDFSAVVKKVNLKPKGVKEIVLEVNDHALDGHLDSLSKMIDNKVEINLEDMVVNFNVTINAKTNQPITEYKVDDKGIVSEVKPDCEQLEADLGLPKEKIETTSKDEQVEREIVDEFILSGMAPGYDDMPNDIADLVKRRLEGESYRKLATELEISSGKIVEIFDEYRKRLAPLATKWWEWKESRSETASKENLPKPNEIVTDNGESDPKHDESDQRSDEHEEDGHDGVA